MNPIILADNRYLDGTPTATDTAAGYDVLNIRDGKTFTHWKGASAGTKYLTVDCGSAQQADSLAIVGHNLGTASASVSLESSDNGASWTERIAPFIPTHDRALLAMISGGASGVVTDTLSDGALTDTGYPGAETDTEIGGSASARYWRIKIVTASIAAKIAVAMVGSRMEFPFPPDAPFAPVKISVEAERARSKSGVFLGEVVRFKPYTISARWSNIVRSFVDDTFWPFWRDHASNLLPFVWAWDFSEYPQDVRFVRLADNGDYAPQVSVLSFYDSFGLEMEGVSE